MTIDEAIQLYTQRAENHEYILHSGEFIGGEGEHMKQDIKRCVSEHRQLAEWLRQLKDLREENKVLMQECDRLIKEKGELLKQHEQIGEYKRLLKSVIDEWHIVCEWGNCGEYCGWYKNGKCTQEWSGKAEALKLIGGSENG